MSEAELIALVEEILEAPSGTVRLNGDLDELGWDSLSNLEFLSIADERYSTRVDPHQLSEASTPADLGALLDRVSSR